MINDIRCLCISRHAQLWVMVGGGIVALCLYFVIASLLRHCVRHTPWKKRLVHNIQLPLLLFCLECALLFAIAISDLTTETASRLLGMIMTMTVGGGALIASKVIFHHFFSTLARDPTQRMALTQAIFFYRAVAIAIVILTLGVALIMFPYIKSLGLGILGSAGVLGFAVGMAARPMILNLLAGFQIALAHIIKIGDRVVIHNQEAQVENIELTRVVLRTWDQRRLLIPISQFIDQSFENWDLKESEPISTVFLYCDFSVSVAAIREHFLALVQPHPAFSGSCAEALVTNLTAQTMEIRLTMSTKATADAFALRTLIRERMVDFLQHNYPHALPCLRHKNLL